MKKPKIVGCEIFKLPVDLFTHRDEYPTKKKISPRVFKRGAICFHLEDQELLLVCGLDLLGVFQIIACSLVVGLSVLVVLVVAVVGLVRSVEFFLNPQCSIDAFLERDVSHSTSYLFSTYHNTQGNLASFQVQASVCLHLAYLKS